MAKVTKYPQGTFSWLETQSTDAKKDKAFYADVFGWEVKDVPMSADYSYTMFCKDGDDVAGLSPMDKNMQDAGIPSYWSAYISVDDIDAVIAKAESLGAKVILPVMDVADSGRMAAIIDPCGGSIAFWQPGKHIGSSRVNEDGALIWNELSTQNPDAVMKFYGELLGWTFDKYDDDGMDYWTIDNKGRMNGGIMKTPDGVQPYWSSYIHVDDITNTVEKIKSNGGSLIQEPTEGGVGTMAILASPTGAQLNIIQSNAVDEWVE